MSEAKSEWVDLHGCQGVIWRVGDQTVWLGLNDFAPADLEHWPLVRRDVLDARAKYKLDLAKAESD